MNKSQAPGKIAIIGAGLIGRGWAIVFARAGYEVAVYDAVPGVAIRALESIRQSLEDLKAEQLIEEPQRVLAQITLAKDIRSALEDAIYVQESVFETVEAKRAVMSDIDAHLPAQAYVGSSSSGIGASLYTGHIAAKSRCLVAHPVNPPYLAPIVELVPAPWTSAETMGATRDLMEQVGQKPVVLSREIEGFLLNRLQGVLLMEAWRLFDDGLASAADIDKTVSEGLGLRWSFMGPFETIDLNAPDGVADYASRLASLYQRIAASTAAHEVWGKELVGRVEAERRQYLPVEKLADRRAWRDRRLMALARHKREASAGD
jgi:L-gulonate 3-dehydrogenase